MKAQQTAYNGKSNDGTYSGLKWYLTALSVILSSLIVVILELQYGY